jgi:4-hydroxybenzoate polyprenyltransferase
MLCHAMFLGAMILIGLMQKLGISYYVGLATAVGLILYQYRLIHNRDRARCFKAFLHNNWVGATVFAGIALDYLIKNT